jgi:hypothetical protein
MRRGKRGPQRAVSRSVRYVVSRNGAAARQPQTPQLHSQATKYIVYQNDMVEEAPGILIEVIFALVWKFVLWPAVLFVAMPVVVVYAFFSATRHRQRFMYSLADAYSSLFSFWDKWFF